jgi:hypothetical protein
MQTKKDMEKPKFKNCQSCGMPLHKDENGGGTNADGSKNAIYCSHCYEYGNFKMPNITVDEMKILVKDKIKAFGFPGFIAGFLTKGIPRLERWKK